MADRLPEYRIDVGVHVMRELRGRVFQERLRNSRRHTSLNRRTQKASFTWAGFQVYLKYYPLPEHRIAHHLYTLTTVP